MKKLEIATLISMCMILLVSCNITTWDHAQSNISKNNKTLFQKYKAQTSANSNSEFNVVQRKVEFEYKKMDSFVEVSVMFTSGFNEGELTEGLQIEFGNGETMMVNMGGIQTREYVENYSYTSSTPTVQTKTINDPGGVDVVVKSDGTTEHVHRPASTKVVNVTENISTNHSSAKSQIFNQAKFRLTFKDINSIENNSIKYFKVHLSNSDLAFLPSAKQIKRLKRFLKSTTSKES